MRVDDRRRLDALTSPRLALGAGAILLGILFLGRELDWLDFDSVAVVWPLLPVVFGVLRLVAGSTLWGSYWTGLGAVLFLYNLTSRPVDLGDVLGPVALLTLGIHLLARAVRDRRGEARPEGDTAETAASVAGTAHAPGGAPESGSGGEGGGGGGGGETIQVVALMSGIERRARPRAFRGGEAVAIMGGCELDLRAAHLAPGRVVLDVLAFWGAVTLYVPRDWDVDCQVVGVLGGVEDNLAPRVDASGLPPVPGAPSRGTLVVRGAAIMGGVEIKYEPDRS